MKLKHAKDEIKEKELLKKRDEIISKLHGRNVIEAEPVWDEYYKLQVEFAKLTLGWKERFCPRCGEVISFPSLSRTDNKTKICGRCGRDEAMNEFYKGKSLGGHYYRGEWIEWE